MTTMIGHGEMMHTSTRRDVAGAARATWPLREATPAILTVDARIERAEPYLGALVEAGHRVYMATGEQDALDMIDGEGIDLVLVDEKAASSLLDRLHAQGHHGVTTIVLADRPDMFVAREVMLKGAYAYLTRPCDPKLLQVMVGDACQPPRYEACG